MLRQGVLKNGTPAKEGKMVRRGLWGFTNRNSTVQEKNAGTNCKMGMKSNSGNSTIQLFDFKGERSSSQGTAVISVGIGKKLYETRVVVADIPDDGTLGLNLLHAMGAHIDVVNMKLINEAGSVAL